jgi:hypothetical protein
MDLLDAEISFNVNITKTSAEMMQSEVEKY